MNEFEQQRAGHPAGNRRVLAENPGQAVSQDGNEA